MIDRHIQDGDLAIMISVTDADDGAIVEVIVEDILTEATLKIICRKKNVIELYSANSVYPPIIFKGRDREKVRIVGRYVGLIRRAKPG